MKTFLKIIAGLILLGGLFVYWFFSKLTESPYPVYNTVELVSTGNEKLFIESENWGVTGDSQLTIITTEDKGEFEVDSTRQIIFKGLDPFLYRVSNDTLFLILGQKSKIPENFKSQWTIVQQEVDNPTMMNSMSNSKWRRI